MGEMFDLGQVINQPNAPTPPSHQPSSSHQAPTGLTSELFCPMQSSVTCYYTFGSNRDVSLPASSALLAPVATTSGSTRPTHSESGSAFNSHDANFVEAASIQYNARLRRHQHQQPCGSLCGEQRTALKAVEPAWGDEEATIREEGSK